MLSNDEEQSHRTLVTTYAGRFIIRVDEATQASKERTLGDKSPNAGKVVHEESYKNLDGTLIGIDKVESKIGGWNWHFHFKSIKEDGQEYTLSLDYASSYAIRFLRTLPSLDIFEPMKLMTHVIFNEGTGKWAYYLTPWQKEKKVEMYYHKDNLRGCPDWVKVRTHNGHEFNKIDQLDFLEEMVKTKIAPQWHFEQPTREELPDTSPGNFPGVGDMPHDFDDSKDDLPF